VTLAGRVPPSPESLGPGEPGGERPYGGGIGPCDRARVRTLIRGGTVVTAGGAVRSDVLVVGERIAAVADRLDLPAERVIDAAGRYVLPGGVDVHTHMGLESAGTVASDDFATGTAAAAWGGTTTIVDYAGHDRGEPLRQGLQRWMARAEGGACIDYGFHLMVREVDDRVLGEMDALVDEGVTSFKLFMAYPGVYMVDDAAIFRVLERAARNGALTVLHAENGGLIDLLVARNLARGRTAPLWHALSRPAELEGEATARAIALAEVAGAPVHIAHLSAAPALEAVHRARERGVAAFAETCPQYLYLSLDDLDRPGFEGAKYVCSPPLRPRRHQHALWEGLRLGDLQVVATDHCPFNFHGQKELGRAASPASPTACPAWRSGSRCCSRAFCGAASAWSASSTWSRPRRPSCSGSTPARGRSRPARTPTSWCSTPAWSGRFRPRPTT
jgi:dihydropyrimidinase